MKIAPVYVLTGQEPLLQKFFIEDLRKKIFPEGSKGFNDDHFSAKEKSWSEIFDLANTFPMLSNWRLITVRNATDIRVDDEPLWLKYLENPPEHTILVLQAEKLDKRKKVIKMLVKQGYLHDLVPPKPNMMPGWVDKLAKQKDLSVDPKARMALVDAIGTNLSRLSSEIEKLELFMAPEKTITVDAVSALVLKSSGDSIFQFTDAVFEGKAKESLTALKYLFDQGTPALVVVAMLARHLKILIKAKFMMNQVQANDSSSSPASALGVPPFLVSKYKAQAKSFTIELLFQGVKKLTQLDTDLKSTGLNNQSLVEKTILEMTSQR
ncbi:MAG: DNA polymerase III subunit delta [Bdellovibrionales bacterium]|nr:DNA polymerase III subunit delta [Bdellovibrionales bacterium]